MTDHQPFVHLHCHSEFSLLDGLSRVDDLVQRAVELNQPAVALTDHGAMYGTIPFYRKCKTAGVKPIIGIETYLAARRMGDKDPQKDKNRYHMLLLAQNQAGYLNLLQVASTAQLEGYYYKPRIDRPFMAQHSEGIIATTGCMAAEIPQAILQGNVKKAHKLMGEYVDIFGKDRLYIELQEHHIDDLTDINHKLVKMASRHGLENNFLVTNDVHYTRAEDADPHQVLLCIQTSSTLQNPKMSFSDNEYYLKSYEEMAQLLKGYPQDVAHNAMQNSLRIYEMCNVDLDYEGYHLPDFDVPDGYTPRTYLRELCEDGLVHLYGAERANSDKALRARLDHELKLIHDMGFDTYFLIVWDLCEWAARSDRWWREHQDPFPYDSYREWKGNDIWWNVRGSGAGSVVAYSLGITNIDPLKNSLIFERFLNPGRVSMPDIDLDYPDDARHLMVAYTKRRYGEEKVAQIITFGTLGARAAIRDVGRAMDLSLPEVDAIARMVPAIPGKPAKIEDVLNNDHEFYSSELEERYKGENKVKRLLDTAQNLEGIARHASSHAAGVIVSDRPLHEYVPLNRPTSGEEGLGGVDRVTQWPMEIVESIGLLKVDFLGLSTLTVMRRAARLIEERYGVAYTMDNIPYDVGHEGPDPSKNPEALFDMLGRGEVAGVFQVEGAGMRRLMREMKPRRFDHIIAAISLYRPGPMENIRVYIRRMHGEEAVEFHHPDLEPILGDTYGILVYQEQIIRIASELAGYEPGDADMIRKAVGKKKKKLIDKHRSLFIEGAQKNGYSREVCEAIWGDIEYFARYGFNKCLPGDVEIVDAASGRLVRIGDLYHKRAHIAETATCDTDNLRLQKGIVTDVLANGVKPVYRLTTSLGRQIEATGNHPFYTYGGWRWLAELEPGDQIATPRFLPVEGKHKWPAYQVIVLGHLLAEGDLCHPHSVYYDTQNETSLQDYINAVEQFENVECVVSLHRTTYSVYAKRREREQAPGVVIWAKSLGIWGKTAVEKEIPAEAFTLANEQIALLLGRLWDGDGSVRKQAKNSIHAYYATASEKLARQVQHLLLRLGIISSVREQFCDYQEGKTGYRVHVMGGEHIRRFAAVVGPHLLRADQIELCEWLLLRKGKATSSRDTIPLGVKMLVRAEKEQAGLTWKQFRLETGVAQREFYPTAAAAKKGFRRETIARVADYVDSSALRRYATSDIYWDEIVSIEQVGEKPTYDLAVADTHNFIANDILVHNSHAADYAKVTGQTAFLKAHYPVEYLTAMLSVERDNTDKVRRYFAEAKNLGIDIAPPDINRSQLDFAIEDEGERPLIRFGLGAIKNAGEAALQLALDEREENGRFADPQDLCERVDLRRVGKRALEFMIKARVFDAWGAPQQFLDALDRLVSYSGTTHDAAAAGQMSLFGGANAALEMDIELLTPNEQLDPVEHKEILEWEKEALGVHVSEHPLERPLAVLEPRTNATISEIDELGNGKQICVAGMVTGLRTLTTKKGNPMAFATLEDLDDKIDLVFFPRTWKQYRMEVQEDQVMLVNGKVQIREGDTNIIVAGVQTNLEIARDGDATPPAESDNSNHVTENRVKESQDNGGDPMPSSQTEGAPETSTAEKGATVTAATDSDNGQDSQHDKADQVVFGEQKNGRRRNGNGHLLVVEIKPVSNWQQVCRQSVKLAEDFNGDDSLRLRVTGQPLAIDFPDQRTQFCNELVDKLERLPGVMRVYSL